MWPKIFRVAGTAATLALAGVSVFGAEAPVAPPSSDPLAHIEGALQIERDTLQQQADEAGAAGSRFSADNFDNTHGYLVANIRQSLGRGSEESTLSAIAQLRSTAKLEVLRKACDELSERVKKARADRNAAFDATVQGAFQHARETLLQAKEPKELDAVLEELGRLTADARVGASNDSSLSRTVNRLQSAATFVSRWQDYLFAVKRGDEASVATAVRNLAESGGSYGEGAVMPRSEILSRLPANRNLNGGEVTTTRESRHSRDEVDAAVAEILDRTRTLDDMPEALRKLADLRKEAAGTMPTNEYSSDLGAATTALRNLQRTRLDLQAGMASTVNFTNYRSDENARAALETRLVPLRAELVKLALPQLLNNAGEKPQPDETVNAYLRRLIEAAKKRADWPSVARGLDVLRTLASAQGGATAEADTREGEAFRQFVSGLNLEAAGQFEPAVTAYFAALKSGALEVPAPVIGEHLAAIEKAHPQEFADGKESTPRPPGPELPEGAFTPRPGRSRTSRSADRPRPEVPVPAAPAAPKSSPAGE